MTGHAIHDAEFAVRDELLLGFAVAYGP